jgi:hypothetical protein
MLPLPRVARNQLGRLMHRTLRADNFIVIHFFGKTMLKDKPCVNIRTVPIGILVDEFRIVTGQLR